MQNPYVHYENLPSPIKDNLSPEQWLEAQNAIILEGNPVPETTSYINIKNGVCQQYQAGERAPGPLLPTHDLAGGRGYDDTQFHTSPPGAHGVP